jgi:ribosome-associated toxin RatA of RatAB toxin-antitoxin module
MRHDNKFKLVISTVGLAFLLVSGPSFAVDFSTVEIERLQSGKTVRQPLSKSRQNGFYGGTGWAVVDAPADVVFAAIQDWDAYPEVFPRTVSAKELSRENDRSLVRMEMGYKFLSIEYHLNVKPNREQNTISFSLVPSRPHDIESVHGYWRLFPQKDGRTLVAYGIAVKLPAGIVTFLGNRLERELEDGIIGLPRYIKRWVEKPTGNRYRKMTARK